MNKVAYTWMAFIVAATFLGVMYITTDAAHADLLVEGAGTTEVNGCYVRNAETESFELEAGDFDIYTAGGSYCRIGLRVDHTNTQIYYVNVGGTCTASAAAAGTWLVDGEDGDGAGPDFAGSEPAPTVTEADCGAAATSTPTTATTTLIQNPTQDLFNAYLLFFLSAFFVMWILRRRV